MKKLLLLVLLLSACSGGQETASSGSGAIYACAQEEDCQDETVEASGFLEEISFEQALADLESGQDTWLYFGFDACPWCQDFLPVLQEVLDETSQAPSIQFVRTRDENGELLYTGLQKEEISGYIGDAMQENDEGELTLYVPLLVHVRDGELLSWHLGTVDGHDAGSEDLTEEQKQLLKEKLLEMLSAEAQ